MESGLCSGSVCMRICLGMFCAGYIHTYVWLHAVVWSRSEGRPWPQPAPNLLWLDSVVGRCQRTQAPWSLQFCGLCVGHTGVGQC